MNLTTTPGFHLGQFAIASADAIIIRPCLYVNRHVYPPGKNLYARSGKSGEGLRPGS